MTEAYPELNDIVDLMRRVEWLEKLLTQRFSRSATIEEQLMGIGVGKRDLPTREECREWAIKLGVPDEFREKLK